MKRLLFTLPLAAAVLLAASTSVCAQDDKPKRPGGGGGAGRVDPAERLKMMAEKLSLTDEQKDKIKDVFAKTREKVKTIRDDSAISDTDKRPKIQELRKAEREDIRAILTPEQQEKFKEMQGGPGGRGGKPKKQE